MARVTKTPGATTEPTADQTDLPLGGDADSNTNGEADVSQATESNTSDQSTSETSSLTEPVEPTPEEIQAKKEYEEFLEWRKNKGKSSEPATKQATTTSGAVATRTRQFVGPNGWTTEEIK